VRIAYWLHWLDGPESGVIKKVNAQAQTWTSLGHDVRIYLLTKRNSVLFSLQRRESVDLPRVSVQGYKSRIDRPMQETKHLRAVLDWAPDILYSRLGQYHPTMSKVARRLPLVFEINSDDMAERRSRHSVGFIYRGLTRRFALRDAAGFVTVTHELAQSPRFAPFGKPTVTIGNGIDLQEYSPLQPCKNLRPRFAFVGSSGQRWHGVDKILHIAELLPCSDFEVIGTNRAEFADMFPPPNVHFHGVLAKEDYQSILARSDVAISTLALERKGMSEACPLKSREYLAYGLPLIAAYKDPDFPTAGDFILQIDGSSEAVRADASLIRDFALKWKGRRVSRAKIRHLDVRRKEERRLEFFQSLLSKEVGR
jgi:glycosyltransferase involved in cell wall biosynthesis